MNKSYLEFIVFGLALIALLILGTWLATRSLTGVPFAQTPVGNIPPPSGYAWSPVLNNEMNGSSVNTSVWNGDYGGPVYWCSNGIAPKIMLAILKVEASSIRLRRVQLTIRRP